MQQLNYNASIKIHGTKGSALGTAVAMPDLEGKRFVKTMKGQLDTLAKLRTGKKLLDWIDHSGKSATIYCAADGLEVSATGSQPLTEPFPQGWQSTVAACIRPFRKAQITIPVPKAREKEEQVAYFKNLFSQMGLPTNKAAGGAELETVLKNAYNGIMDNRSPKFTDGPGRINDPLHAGAEAAGIAETELMQMAQGLRQIPPDVYFKLAFFFYDFLTSGAGIDTCIRMINRDDWPADFKTRTYSPKTNPDDSPGYIVLGHELIHSFRMMIGKRLVHNGWEEEAMTSGIWQFSRWNYTENSLRGEAGLPLRNTYQSVPHVNSPWAMSAMSNQNK